MTRLSGRDRVLRDAIAYFATHSTGDVSMRGLAAELGTSHRMLNYYFGSRDGLLTAVVEAVEADQRALLEELVDEVEIDLHEQLRRFWQRVGDAALIYAPLFFELSADAMRGLPHAESLRAVLIAPWLELLEARLRRWGYDEAAAAAQARLGLAVARGLLFDLLVSGDRAGVDGAMEAFITAVAPIRR